MRKQTFVGKVSRDDIYEMEIWECEDLNLFMVSTMKDFRTANSSKTPLPNGTEKFVVYGYKHGGLVLSLTPFSCKWDSGIAGYIVAENEEAANRLLKSYNQYLGGTFWIWEVTDEEGNSIDSCGGFWSEEEAKEDCEAVILRLTKDYNSINPPCDHWSLYR